MRVIKYNHNSNILYNYILYIIIVSNQATNPELNYCQLLYNLLCTCFQPIDKVNDVGSSLTLSIGPLVKSPVISTSSSVRQLELLSTSSLGCPKLPDIFISYIKQNKESYPNLFQHIQKITVSASAAIPVEVVDPGTPFPSAASQNGDAENTDATVTLWPSIMKDVIVQHQQNS